MKTLLRPRPERLVLCLALLAANAGLADLVPTEWRYRQPLEVATPGLVQVPLPPATFDAAQPGLADLRVLDPSGREVPYFLDRGRNRPIQGGPRRLVPVKSFRVSPAVGGTALLIEPGPAGPLAFLELATRNPYFLKAAHVDVSADGQEWQSLGSAVPLFRQFGAEQLLLQLGGQPATFVRITLDDVHSRQVEFTGARVMPSTERLTVALPVLTAVDAVIRQREEFAGETVLTVTLPGRNLPLAALSLDVPDPLFTRQVKVTVREAQGDISSERVIAVGALYRVALDGAEPRAQLDLPADFNPAAHELFIHIVNHDSPPLTVTRVQAKLYPLGLRFGATAAGTYTLLMGNPQRAPARYDIAAFSDELRTATAALATPGAVEETPDYHPGESLAVPPLPEIPLAGAPLDARDWTERRAVRLDQAGVQELELDPAALAGARDDFADLRVLHAGNQIPYLLERPALSRSLEVTAEIVPDKSRPSVSRWRVKLPRAGLPLNRVDLTTSTSLFSRELRLYELVPDEEGHEQPVPLASTSWNRKPEPGSVPTRWMQPTARLRTDTLWIETDNGDNPAITLTTLRVVYPVVRLVFKTAETADFALLYGNPSVAASHYDLSLVAARLLTAPRAAARLEPAPAPAEPSRFKGRAATLVFWGALALVVIVLLVVMAKLLPKPPAAP